MTDRVSCKTTGCSNTILPATAERTGGFCMPCVGNAADRERKKFIELNRKDVNEFEGITDPVEAIKIIQRKREHDPLVNWIPHSTPIDKLYGDLSKEQQRRLADYAQSLLGGERNDEAESIILCLAAFTDAPMQGCLRAMVAHGSFWPSFPFHRSSPEIRDLLIARLERDQENRNHLLLALAWIGDQTVVDLFASWKKHPPSWSSSLYLPPEDYSREAGWELTAGGQRRDLFFHSCEKLHKGPSSSPRLFQAITPSEDSCPWCNQMLTNLVAFAPNELGMKEVFDDTDQVQVTTCEVCTAFGTVYGEYDLKGLGRWFPGNSRPEYLPDDSDGWDRLPPDSLSPAGLRHPLSAADQFLPTTFSQIGGHPTWIQDASYPRCIQCSESMMFVAQIAHDEIVELSEGMYYSFVCAQCRTTATTYQQT